MERYRYPSTPHHPLSRSRTEDDSVLQSDEHFVGSDVVITLKLDGENFNGYQDGCHARSPDSRHHVSRDWSKAFWGTVGPQVPEGWRITAENVYASHSIHYDDLSTYLFGICIWNDQNICLSWDDTLIWFGLLDITPVPVVYECPYDRKLIAKMFKELDKERNEGFVIRMRQSFAFDQFSDNVCKLVRQNHVTTDEHWMTNWYPNELKK